MNKIAIVRDPLYLKHSNGPLHPEAPQRLTAIDEMLSNFPLKDRIEDIPARDATLEELAWIHEESYIRRIERTSENRFTVLDPDTSASADSYAAALRAAGGVLEAVEAVFSGCCRSAFALVRPPGHHAEAGRAMGFCLFNNAAIAAMYALRRHECKRVLIVDWDVHHGNGSMHSFYNSPEVLYFSVHQYPHYPGTGRVEEIGGGEGRGYTVNIPLSAGQGDEAYLFVFEEILAPLARGYNPQLILVSAGFDAHRDDPLAGMTTTSKGYGLLAAILHDLAAECCGGRIVFTLEGGYNLKALADSTASVLGVLAGEAAESSSGLPEPAGEVRRVVQQSRRVLSPFLEFL